MWGIQLHVKNALLCDVYSSFKLCVGIKVHDSVLCVLIACMASVFDSRSLTVHVNPLSYSITLQTLPLVLLVHTYQPADEPLLEKCVKFA